MLRLAVIRDEARTGGVATRLCLTRAMFDADATGRRLRYARSSWACALRRRATARIVDLRRAVRVDAFVAEPRSSGRGSGWGGIRRRDRGRLCGGDRRGGRDQCEV